jgi:hypothetical protein
MVWPNEGGKEWKCEGAYLSLCRLGSKRLWPEAGLEDGPQGLGHSPPGLHTSYPLPPPGPHLLKIPQLCKIVSPTEAQVFKYTSPWVTFYIQTVIMCYVHGSICENFRSLLLTLTCLFSVYLYPSNSICQASELQELPTSTFERRRKADRLLQTREGKKGRGFQLSVSST